MVGRGGIYGGLHGDGQEVDRPTVTKKLTLKRDVTKSECRWLDRDFTTGETVYRYSGPTYGCVGAGIACSEKENETPFFELPRDALD